MRRASYSTGRLPAIGKSSAKLQVYSKRYSQFENKNFRPAGNVKSWEFPNMGHPDAEVSVRFFVPSTRNVDRIKSDAVFRKRVADAHAFFSHLFGGGTQIAGYGNYRFNGKNIAEPVAIVETSTSVGNWKKFDIEIKNWMQKSKKFIQWYYCWRCYFAKYLDRRRKNRCSFIA